MCPQAIDAARARKPTPPGAKPRKGRAKKGWLFLPDMPDRPELSETPALVYAVRLARPTTVRALLAAHAGKARLHRTLCDWLAYKHWVV